MKAPLATRRRMMPPTQQQGSQHPLIEEMQAQAEKGCARERPVIPNVENYLDKSDGLKFEVGELEFLVGPEDSEVDLMYVLTHAKRRSSRIFEIFSAKEK